MKPYEFTKFCHPKLGKFVYKHNGTGLIVDNLFKPMKSVLSSVFKNIAKPVAKKALESGIKHTGERLGKKMSEKSGDLIMKSLSNIRRRNTKQKSMTPITPAVQQESTDMILNRLISGNGIKRRRKII